MKKILLFLSFLPLFSLAQQAPNYKPNKYGRTPDVVPKPVAIPASLQRVARVLAAGDTAWQAPIMITKGGRYTGFFKSTDPSVPAIQINTGERVELYDFVADGNGEQIVMGYGSTNLYMHHGTIMAHPNSDKQYGKVNIWGARYVRIENVTMIHTGGILIEKWQGTGDSTLWIKNIKSYDVDKRYGNGNPGSHRAGIQLSTIFGLKNCEIAYNQIINTPDKSWVEDIINIYNVSGAPGFPVRIHDNYLAGSHPVPALANGHTGSGLTYDGTPENKTFDNMTGYHEAYGNVIVDCQNALLNIAAGHDVNAHDNRLISAGLLPSGVTSPGYWAGCAIFNGSNVSADVFVRNSIKNNVIAYVRQGINIPFPNRHDYNANVTSPIVVSGTDNTHLPNPITKAMEVDEYAKYVARVAGGYSVVITPTTGTSVRVGESKSGTITAVDSTGKAVSFKTGSVIITGDAYSQITRSATDEKAFSIKGLAAGTSTITVQLTTNNGKTLTQTAVLTVLPLLEEAVGINITFQ